MYLTIYIFTLISFNIKTEFYTCKLLLHINRNGVSRKVDKHLCMKIIKLKTRYFSLPSIKRLIFFSIVSIWYRVGVEKNDGRDRKRKTRTPMTDVWQIESHHNIHHATMKFFPDRKLLHYGSLPRRPRQLEGRETSHDVIEDSDYPRASPNVSNPIFSFVTSVRKA